MHAIRNQEGFCPEATWLLAEPEGYCGTIQGICVDSGFGAVQNLGVIPEWRGLGPGESGAIKGFARLSFRGYYARLSGSNCRKYDGDSALPRRWFYDSEDELLRNPDTDGIVLLIMRDALLGGLRII